jgi:hypothetical protein
VANGVEAVKAEIMRAFNPPKIDEGSDDLHTVLRFSAEGHDFTVTVKWEFDEDYPNTRFRIDLKRLGPILRASKTSKAIVGETGVSPV